MRTVGVDIGGTKIAAGFLDETGRPVLLGTAPTSPYDGEANVRTIERLIDDPRVVGAEVLAVSVATTFENDGALRDPRGWFGWKGQVLADVLTKPERQALVFADAAAGAVGECTHGAGAGYDHLLYVTVGTGVSHSFVVNGEPLHGARNAAYFSGYTPQARCDRRQCDFPHVEGICSGPGLARAFFGPEARDARPVIAAATAGDPRAVDVVDHAAWHLGALIATMVSMYDPSGVVIGGGLGTGASDYRQQAVEVARSLITTEHGKGVPVVPASLGEMSCWVGAIEMAAMQHAGPPTHADATLAATIA
ncbi:ROK family protein [Plantibacter sp. MPB07]|uniref:ROK family protein n=1 Tax=Plantibacter sp. MPB07 TaxID=3388853 RepID=UPI003986390B